MDGGRRRWSCEPRPFAHYSAHRQGSQDKPAPLPRHPSQTNAYRPRYDRATQAKQIPRARATPTPPKPNKCLWPAPRPRQCPVTPGGTDTCRGPVAVCACAPRGH
eukprot:gene24650-biopygen20909